jgi:hypothetical protein
VHGCSAGCDDLHCGVGNALCECLNEIGMGTGSDALNGGAYELAVVNGCGECVAATRWGKIGVHFNVDEEWLRLLLLLWVNAMRRIKAHVAYGDAVTLTRARGPIGTIRIWSDGLVGLIPRRAKGSVDDAHRIAVLLHVMHAHDIDPSKGSECARGHRGRQAVSWRSVDDAPQRGLAARAKEHGVTQITQGTEEAQGDEVLGWALPKAESRVEDQPLRRNTQSATARGDCHHLVHELLGEVCCLFGSGHLSPVMHDDDRHAALSGELEHLIACTSAPYVIQHVRPCVERSGGNFNLLGVGAEREGWEHTPKSFNSGD